MPRRPRASATSSSTAEAAGLKRPGDAAVESGHRREKKAGPRPSSGRLPAPGHKRTRHTPPIARSDRGPGVLARRSEAASTRAVARVSTPALPLQASSTRQRPMLLTTALPSGGRVQLTIGWWARRVSSLARSASLVKAGATPAFVLARVFTSSELGLAACVPEGVAVGGDPRLSTAAPMARKQQPRVVPPSRWRGLVAHCPK
jgi:hypothetical protein